VAACVPPDLRRLSPVDCIGQEPTWPESIEDARLRMVARVEQYAEWAARLDGVNFVLVTHGDCVGSCLTLALARGVPTAEKVVEKVDYCGYALLERTWDPGEPNIGLMDDTAKWQVMHGHVVLRDRSEPASYAMHRAAGATEAQRKQQSAAAAAAADVAAWWPQYGQDVKGSCCCCWCGNAAYFAEPAQAEPETAASRGGPHCTIGRYPPKSSRVERRRPSTRRSLHGGFRAVRPRLV